MKTLKNLLIAVRPKQWVKNLFVFAALLFVRGFYEWGNVARTILAFVLFCAAASAVYLLNDLVDLPRDREHPARKMRPLAAGKVSSLAAILFCLGLVVVALLGAFALSIAFGLVVAGYFLLNVLYSFYLKQIAILDVMSIALGFVLRVIGGAAVISVPFSAWMLLCTFFLTLFLAVQKRKSELALSATVEARPMLRFYSAAFLEEMSAVALATTIIGYTFYTFSSEHSQWFIITVPFVVFGLFYYSQAVGQQKLADNGPSDVFLREWPLQITVALWILASGLILILAR